MNIGSRLDEACAQFRDRSALFGGDEYLRYGELRNAAHGIMADLKARGIGPDEPVVIADSNHPLDMAAFFGTWLAGGVAVPVRRSATTADADSMLSRTDSRFVVNSRPDLPAPECWKSGDVVVRLDRPPSPVHPLLKDAAFLVFTSGSTGEPKGVVLSHAAFVGKLDMIQSVVQPDPCLNTLLVLPLSFPGQVSALPTLFGGGTLFMHESFEATAALDALRAHQITLAVFTPNMLHELLTLVENGVAVSYRGVLFSGGEPLDPALGKRTRDIWPNASLWNVYGTTETSSCDFFVPPNDHDEGPGTIGRPGPGIDYRIAGSPGELHIRSPYVMNGYFDDAELTGAALDDGWFRTGDVAKVRKDGRVELLGRIHNLIPKGEVKIPPLEIETAMAEHPGVAMALAVGLPDGTASQTIHLLVVAKPGATLKRDILLDWAARHLERIKRPGRIHLVDDLPKGRTGKVDRIAAKRMIGSNLLKESTGGRQADPVV